MIGDAWEMISSLSADYPYDARDCRKAQKDPDDVRLVQQITRGISWGSDSFEMMIAADRVPSATGVVAPEIGFCCARPYADPGG